MHDVFDTWNLMISDSDQEDISNFPPELKIRVAASGTIYTINPLSLNISATNAKPFQKLLPSFFF